MIHNCIAYAPQSTAMNIGAVYNQFMEMIGDDDWACFLDHDAMFTTHNWYKILEAAVKYTEDKKVPIGLITGVTNRIGNVEQRIFDKRSIDAQNHDMYFHRKIGNDRLTNYGLSVRTAKNLISGIVMLTSKKVWKTSGGFKDGFLSVDNEYDRRARMAGFTTVIMDGLYIYHWYRADGYPMQGLDYPIKTNLPRIILKEQSFMRMEPEWTWNAEDQ